MVIVNPTSVAKKKERVDEVTDAIKSVMNASRKRYLMATVPKASLAEPQHLPPAGVPGPTVMNICAGTIWSRSTQS